MSYFIIIGMILLFSIVFEKFRNINLNVIFYISLVFSLVFFTGLRGNIEPDYENYLDIFNNSKLGINLGVEPGFYYLNSFISNWGLDFQWVIFLMALFTVIIKINFFIKNSKNYLFSFLIYYCSMFFLYDFIAIRQALAMAIFMISVPYIVERKFLPYLICIIFASTFHLSALVLLPIYFFIHLSFNKFIFYIILLLSTLTSVFKYDIHLTSLLLDYISLPGFANNKIEIYAIEDIYAALSFRQLILGFLFVYLFSKKMDKSILVFINLYIFGIMIATLLNEIPQLSYRLKAYFFWTEAILVVYFVDKLLKNYVWIKIVAYLILGALYSLSLYSYFLVLSQRHESYIYPYKLFLE